jgi:hypothetical protein
MLRTSALISRFNALAVCNQPPSFKSRCVARQTRAALLRARSYRCALARDHVRTNSVSSCLRASLPASSAISRAAVSMALSNR